MNQTNKQKKALILLMTYIIILFTPKLKKSQSIINYNYDYAITKNMEFAHYDDYHIYIGSKEYIDKIYDNDTHNIYIIDGRGNSNPNIEIYNSSFIISHKQRLTILKILLEYERKYPTEWNRTLNSMENEWFIHNLCYYLNLETHRTSEVDLDNNDEENYKNLLAIIRTLLNDELYQKETDKLTKTLTK